MVKKTLTLLLIVMMCYSCASKKDIVYLSSGSTAAFDTSTTEYQNTLQRADKLVITVTTEEPELANPFNLMYLNMRSTDVRTANDDTLYSYQIDQNGDIEFPILGKISLIGLTRIQAENKIKELLKKELKDPGVSIKVLNFKISVLGEVLRPGEQIVGGERITIFEALSRAGDLTIYGKRKEVLIIREKDGVRTINEVDLTDASILQSPFYYLAHNDVIYIEPNKTRVNSSVVGPNLTVGISAISLLVTIIALSTR